MNEATVLPAHEFILHMRKELDCEKITTLLLRHLGYIFRDSQIIFYVSDTENPGYWDVMGYTPGNMNECLFEVLARQLPYDIANQFEPGTYAILTPEETGRISNDIVHKRYLLSFPLTNREGDCIGFILLSQNTAIPRRYQTVGNYLGPLAGMQMQTGWEIHNRVL